MTPPSFQDKTNRSIQPREVMNLALIGLNRNFRFSFQSFQHFFALFLQIFLF